MAETLCGFGSFRNGRLGFGDVPTKVSASNEVAMGSQAFHVVRKGERSGSFTSTKIKNISGQVIVLQVVNNIPKNLPPVRDITLTPGRTADVILAAYDPEQIRELRRKFKITVDPVSR